MKIFTRIVLFFFICMFGVLTYKSSDLIIVNEFTVIEKIEKGLYLKYIDDNNEVTIYKATKAEYIKAKVDEVFIKKDNSHIFYVYLLLMVGFFITWLFSLGLGFIIFDMLAHI